MIRFFSIIFFCFEKILTSIKPKQNKFVADLALKEFLIFQSTIVVAIYKNVKIPTLMYMANHQRQLICEARATLYLGFLKLENP